MKYIRGNTGPMAMVDRLITRLEQKETDIRLEQQENPQVLTSQEIHQLRAKQERSWMWFP
jgi:hypothetical protein